MTRASRLPVGLHRTAQAGSGTSAQASPFTAEEEFVLDLAGRAVHVTCSVMEAGRVRYLVHGPRLSGAFVVVPHCAPGGPVLPRLVRVQFGDGLQPINKYRTRETEPVVHGITLAGGTNAVDPDRLPRWFDLATDAAGRAPGDYLRRLPDGTHARTSLLLEALLRHWRTRPDRAQLARAAAIHSAEEFAAAEQRAAEALQEQLATLSEEQAAARRAVNQVNGVLRRRSLPVAAAAAETVRLPFFDHRGQRLGELTVRERAVNHLPGIVEYEVDGGRVRGVFSVGPDRYSGCPVPRGVYVYYGRPRSRYGHVNDDEPTVNGIRLSFGWSTSYPDEITATAPAHLPASMRTGPTTSHSAPDATARRASGVLRALALHYLARADVGALRLAAGQAQGPDSLAQARERVRRLRKQADKKRSQVRHHLRRAGQYLALLKTSPGGTLTLSAQAPAVQNLEESWSSTSSASRPPVSASTSSGPVETRTALCRAA